MWHHGCMATLDPPLDVLRRQIVAASSVTLGEIGWIGDPDHQSRTSAHNPEYPAPAGNPPGEVDAIDPPHAPSRGADMGVVTESLRQSRDRRIRLVIFNRHIFSSYSHEDGPAWSWRPYSGDNPHTGHAHIERNDSYRDDLSPWQIGIDEMNPWIQHVMNYRLEAVIALRDVVKVPAVTLGGKAYPAFSEANVLAATLKAQNNPDIDETKLAELLAPTIRDIFADLEAEQPVDGLTEDEVIAAIGDAFGRARFGLAPSN